MFDCNMHVRWSTALLFDTMDIVDCYGPGMLRQSGVPVTGMMSCFVTPDHEMLRVLALAVVMAEGDVHQLHALSCRRV